MNISSQYASFSLLVSIAVCACICIILAQVIRKHQYAHLSWLIPMAIGHTSSATIAFLYALNPRYWYHLARTGSYPLLIIGVVAGLLMVYGWVRFAMTFLGDDGASASLPPSTAAEESQEGTWPPPPSRPQ